MDCSCSEFNIIGCDDENDNANSDECIIIDNSTKEVRINMNVIGEEISEVVDEVLSVKTHILIMSMMIMISMMMD